MMNLFEVDGQEQQQELHSHTLLVQLLIQALTVPDSMPAVPRNGEVWPLPFFIFKSFLMVVCAVVEFYGSSNLNFGSYTHMRFAIRAAQASNMLFVRNILKTIVILFRMGNIYYS